MKPLDAIERCLFAPSPPPGDSVRSFLQSVREHGTGHPLDRALTAGSLADRLAFVLAGAYRCATEQLVPGSSRVSLAVTEPTGGHPRDLQATLVSHASGGTLSGEKVWTTLAEEADEILILANHGPMRDGRRSLRLVRVFTGTPELAMTSMPPTPFTPELSHAALHLDGVPVSPQAILPGDGWADYVRPFRAIEDQFMTVALLGHLLAIGHFPGPWVASACSALTTLLSLEPHTLERPAAAAALHGAMTLTDRLVAEVHASHLPREAWERWQRDLPVLRVGRAARARRLSRVQHMGARKEEPSL